MVATLCKPNMGRQIPKALLEFEANLVNTVSSRPSWARSGHFALTATESWNLD